MKKNKTSFHLGEQIRAQTKERRIGPTELGLLINTSKQNVYGIFKRPSINTDLLEVISEALNYDFFHPFSESLQIGPASEMLKRYTELKQEAKALKKEIAYLKQINTLQNKVSVQATRLPPR